MKNKLLFDLGENYGYLKKLMENRIELVKLDLAEYFAKFIGRAIIFILILSLGGIALLGLLIALIIYIGEILNSLTSGLLIVSGLILLVCACLYIFRVPLIFKPAAHLIYSLIDDEEEVIVK